jgi:hypothetical protein
MNGPGICYCGAYGGGRHTKSARCDGSPEPSPIPPSSKLNVTPGATTACGHQASESSDSRPSELLASKQCCAELEEDKQKLLATIEHMTEESVRTRWMLHSIVRDLPTKRDWLDPAIEREARAYLDHSPPETPRELAPSEAASFDKAFARSPRRIETTANELLEIARIVATMDCFYSGATHEPDCKCLVGRAERAINPNSAEKADGDCQHDLLRPDTTIEVIDPWKAKCKVCITFFDLPGKPAQKTTTPLTTDPARIDAEQFPEGQS